MQFAFWSQTGCEYKIVFKYFVCLDLCGMHSNIYSMQSTLLRLEWEDGENKSPSWAQRGSALECAWQCGLIMVQVGERRRGSEDHCSGTEGLCLSSICTLGRRGVLNPAPMAWCMLASHPRLGSAQREAGSFCLDPALALMVGILPGSGPDSKVWSRCVFPSPSVLLWLLTMSASSLASQNVGPKERRTVVTP